MPNSPLPFHEVEPQRLSLRPGKSDISTEELQDYPRLANRLCQTSVAILHVNDRAPCIVESSSSEGVVGLLLDDNLADSLDRIQSRDEAIVIRDTLLDARTCEAPFVIDKPFVRFYACVPIFDRDGSSLGTLRVLDTAPRESFQDELGDLRFIARQVSAQLSLREQLCSADNESNHRCEFQPRLERITAQLPGMVYQFQLNPDGTSCMPYASNGIREMYGLNPEDVTRSAEAIFKMIHPEDYEPLVESIQLSAKTLNAWQHEYRCKCPDGSMKWLYGNAKPLRIANGAVLWHGFITEITKQKNIEEELIAARERAEAASLSKDNFLANMSHEIRTPLTTILGHAELLRDWSISNVDRDAHLNVIQGSGKHLLTIINDILDLSKIESGKLAIERISLSPTQLVGEVLSYFREAAREKGLLLSQVIEGSIPATIQTDPVRLRQILVNLVGNAIKFTVDGEVKVIHRFVSKFPNVPPMLSLEVYDTGIGIDDDQQRKLFSPFVQADSSTTRKYGGTGLGLTISRRMAHILGGDVTLKSLVGRGSSFTVTIETGELEGVAFVDSVSHEPVQVTSKAEQTTLSKGARILIVDDSVDIQRLLKAFLTKAGAIVDIAENGRVAVNQILGTANGDRGRLYDLLLMDVQMPVLDGCNATLELRSRGYTGPIVALTANAMSEDRAKCFAAGFNDFATKPINREKLIAVCNAWIRNRST